MPGRLWIAGALSALVTVAACGQGEPASPPATGAPAPADAAREAIERGRRSYLANCTACHNNDPALPGAIGPEIAGSSRELIEARVLRAEYPPGYTPKRSSHAMVAMPFLKDSIGDLAAYLGSVAKP
jgi:mono/diheme cytochrome c family protein